MERFQVFISYSRLDMELVRQIRDRIEAFTGAKCWIDLRAIESGTKRFTSDIIDGINNCEVFLFMLTEHSQKSEFALRELDFADKKGKHVVIINVNDCLLMDEFQFLYGLTDTIRWNDTPQREKLLRDMRRWVTVDEPKPDPEKERQEKEEAARKACEAAERERKSRVEEKPVANPKPKKKYLLWVIGFIAVVVSVLILLLSKSKPEPQSVDGNLIFTVKGVSFVMKPVDGGTFQMGTENASADEEPAHDVTLSSFYLAETEVTQALWKAVMGSNPSCFRGDNLPVEQVNWNDCQEFVRKLKRLTGKNFRLPTEAEWEYAARGGSNGNGYKYAGSSSIDNVAWYDGNSELKTHAVMTKSPNELGLYDMSGNVCEWCSDRYSVFYYSESPSYNPLGPSSGSFRVERGGCWCFDARPCRLSNRSRCDPGIRENYLGFRLALSQ